MTTRHLLLAVLLVAGVGSIFPARDAEAVLLTYEFHGTLGADSSLNLGGGPINLSGASFVVTGHTISDVDLFASDGVGEFAATSTYDFGGLGSFTTDAGGDFYVQTGLAASGPVARVGLTDFLQTTGFVADFLPPVPGDPDFPVAIGTQTATSTLFGNPRVITNAAEHALVMNFTSIGLLNVSVPEPATIGLLGPGLLGLALGARRRKGPRTHRDPHRRECGASGVARPRPARTPPLTFARTGSTPPVRRIPGVG